MPTTPDASPPPAPRLLFLDDDPRRAAAFAVEHPQAIWVRTASACVAQLEGPWDEVHLDHDLEGRTFVDSSRDDCGMAVVRWLTEEPRPHLRRTTFVIHTHNPHASCAMAFRLEASGYRVLIRPFGPRHRGEGLLARLRRLLVRR